MPRRSHSDAHGAEFFEGEVLKMAEIYQDVYDLFGGQAQPTEHPVVTQIPIHKLTPNKKHTFRVEHDAELDQLADSIRVLGLQEPVIVKQIGRNQYEIVSGHRRVEACKITGITEVDCIVREASTLDNDRADIAMVDTNLGGVRRNFKPSELMRSLVVKRDAYKNLAKTEVFEGDLGERIADGSQMSRASIYKYIKLEGLIPELLDMADDGRLNLDAATRLAGMDKSKQMEIAVYLRDNEKMKVNSKKAAALEALGDDISPEALDEVMKSAKKDKEKGSEGKLKPGYPSVISQFFPAGTTIDEMTIAIVEALKKTKASAVKNTTPSPKLVKADDKADDVKSHGETKDTYPSSIISGRARSAYDQVCNALAEVFEITDYGNGVEITGVNKNGEVGSYRVSMTGSIDKVDEDGSVISIKR